jgi:hypothetical protein
VLTKAPWSGYRERSQASLHFLARSRALHPTVLRYIGLNVLGNLRHLLPGILLGAGLDSNGATPDECSQAEHEVDF